MRLMVNLSSLMMIKNIMIIPLRCLKMFILCLLVISSLQVKRLANSNGACNSMISCIAPPLNLTISYTEIFSITITLSRLGPSSWPFCKTQTNAPHLGASSITRFDQPIPTKGVYLPPYLSSKLNVVTKVHTWAWDKGLARC